MFTEEVLLAVSVTDEKGRFDPSLEKEELLVLEDGVPQEIRSARRVPASVLLLVGTGGEMNPSMKTNTTREFVARLVARLAAGDRIAAMQYGGDAEIVQDWTTDGAAALEAIRRKLSSKRGARLAAAMRAAAARFEEMPQGNRHLVLVTDGVDDAAEGKAGLEEAVKTLLAAGVAVHVISYSRMGRRALRRVAPPVQVTGEKTRRTAADIARELMNPAKPPVDVPDIFVTIDLDFPMRRKRAAYTRAMREGEQWLGPFAEETGGTTLLPLSEAEMLAGSDALARAIDSRYVVTYRPKRPLASAASGEYRRVAVVARRVGLRASARRGYVVTPTPARR
ncbi:MAG TPA: VWA domain-containing protein [Pyrinomonadaceae bacterium]